MTDLEELYLLNSWQSFAEDNRYLEKLKSQDLFTVVYCKKGDGIYNIWDVLHILGSYTTRELAEKAIRKCYMKHYIFKIIENKINN